MKGNNRELFFISLAFLLTVVAWIIVDIYHLQNNKKFSVNYQKSMQVEIKPLTNLRILERLGKKK